MSTATEPTEIELELTYLASRLPEEINNVEPKRLVDVYVPETGVDHARLRLRQKGSKYEITKKVPLRDGDASAHTEMTIPLDENEFTSLISISQKRIIKDRYNVEIAGHPAEVDVFREELSGLVLIDFEFSTEEEKMAFKQPSVALCDVTQEDFIAGGLLAGKTYQDIEHELQRFNYTAL
jgi:CYTH domain-containing protein